MRMTFLGTMAVISALTANPAAAQSVSNGYSDPRIDNRLQLSLTLPLGGEQGDDYRQPRIELSSVRRNNSDFAFNFRPEQQREFRSSFAVTLQDQPKTLINGRFAEPQSDHNNLTTGQVLIIGGLAVLALSVIAITDFTDAIDDLSDPD